MIWHDRFELMFEDISSNDNNAANSIFVVARDSGDTKYWGADPVLAATAPNEETQTLELQIQMVSFRKLGFAVERLSWT